MGDGNGELKQPVVDQAPPELPKVEAPEENHDTQLLITMKREGGLQVAGPGDGRLFDEPLCFWLLDKAKDFIKLSNHKKQQSGIILPGSTLRRP